jgi:hypothetical protein
MGLKLKKPTAEMDALLRRSGSNDYEIARAAQRELAKALTLPLKQGVLKGDIIAGIFEPINFLPGQSVEFPLDFLSPGSEKDYVAFTIPNTGRIPDRHIEGDYVMVPTYDVGASIDWALKYSRDARWDVLGRAMQVLEAMFVRKANDDGWHTILAAGTARNLVVSDDQATPGLFTKRLIALMQTIMRRNAGGNSTSTNKGKLTDLWVSPESNQDVLSWDLTQVPDALRQQIYLNWENNGLAKIGPVTLHDIDELGVSQDYQLYFANTLGGTLPGAGNDQKLEIVVGLDLVNRDSFVMPVRAEVEVFEDPNFHRQRRAGVYGWGEHGFSVLDSRRVLLGAV